MKRKKRRKPVAKQPPSASSSSPLKIAAVLLLGALVVLYLYVDNLVVRRLRNREHSLSPVVYSQPLTLPPAKARDGDQLLKELSDRGYRRVAELTEAGQYQHGEQKLAIFRHAFISPEGSSITEQQIFLDLRNGTATTINGQELAALVLEPRVVSYLGPGERRKSTYKTLEEIPEDLQQAVLTIEDQRFYSHFGLDIIGILRALRRNLLALEIVEGGSTITQQLAKNILFTPRRSIQRKILEALAAVSLESRLSKREIFERYLNEVYLGQDGPIALHGVAAASHRFFSKELEQLTLSEAAMIAGMIRAPSYYAPHRHYTRAIARRDVVLTRMEELGVITRETLQGAQRRQDKIAIAKTEHRRAPYFLAAMQEELGKSINPASVPGIGLILYTGLSIPMQDCAENAISKGLADLEQDFPRLKRNASGLQAALVAIEPYSGLIRAWVGGRSFSESQFDRSRQARRQIGSTVKPFLYLSALDTSLNNYKAATPMSILPDRPIEIRLPNGDLWAPQNYDLRFHGDVTLRYALERSLNIPAVHVASRIGWDTLADTLTRFRVASSPPAVPALALGAVDADLLHLTAAYAAIANGGIYVKPRLYISVLEQDGSMITTSPITEERIANDAPIYVLTNMLQGVVERGTGSVVRSLGFNRIAAGKTGTSNDYRDAWFLGFTPTLTAGVWVGFDDNKPLGLSGGKAAAPIWADFMRCAEPFYAEAKFIIPSNVVLLAVDPQRGVQIPNPAEGEGVREVFVRGTEPPAVALFKERQPSSTRGWEVLDTDPPPTHRKKGFWDVIFG